MEVIAVDGSPIEIKNFEMTKRVHGHQIVHHIYRTRFIFSFLQYHR